MPDVPATLGPFVKDWIESFCRHGPGDVYAQPVTLTTEECAFLDAVYALDESGKRVVDVGVYSRGKGCRKTELGAWVTLAEVEGPVRLHRRGREMWAGPPTDPYIPIAATTENQADTTLYGALRTIIAASPHLAGKFDVGLERILCRQKSGRIDLIQTRNPNALEGAKPTFTVGEELHVWEGPALHSAWAIMRRNLRKRAASQPWIMAPTTTYEPGNGSVLEGLHDAVGRHSGGVRAEHRLLYDHREAATSYDLDDPQALTAAINDASGDAYWRDPVLIGADFYDPTVTHSAFRRFWLNQAVSVEDAWIDLAVWNGCSDATLGLKDKDAICVGFDGSLTEDATALVACRLEDGALFLLGCWEPHGGDPINQALVDGIVTATFDRYDVVRFYADPPRWQDWVSAWESRWPKLVAEWWTNRTVAMGNALERFHTAVVTGQLVHDGDSTLARHVGNARRRDVRGHMAIRKDEPWSPRKIDAAVAAVLAYEARADAIADGALTRRLHGAVYGFGGGGAPAPERVITDTAPTDRAWRR